MSYDNPDRRTYQFGTFDFGGGADGAFGITGPKGKKGTLVDYGVQGCTEAHAAGTLLPQVSVGTAADPDAYGDEFSLGTLAVKTGKSILSTYKPTDAGYATYMLNRTLPADTAVVLTCVAGTGSGLTGMSVPFITIDWDY